MYSVWSVECGVYAPEALSSTSTYMKKKNKFKSKYVCRGRRVRAAWYAATTFFYGRELCEQVIVGDGLRDPRLSTRTYTYMYNIYLASAPTSNPQTNPAV